MSKNLYLLLLSLFTLSSLQAQLIIIGNVQQSNINTSGFTVSYTSNPSSTPVKTYIEYGLTTALELGGATNNQVTTQHSISLTGLSPASFYYVRPCAINGTDTTRSPKTYYYSTASNSTGEIKVYFNKSIDNTVSNGTFPTISNSPAAIQAALIGLIDSAVTSVDVAVYNNSTPAIVTALTNAHNRGVRVRYIADDVTTANTALNPAPAFPLLKVNPVNLMHNKFMIIDADAVNSSYVWTGSMNWTTGNINSDFNNVIVIQDQALAKAYTIEFEEMWGSSGASPNSGNSKAGSQKSDNTPHLFIVGGKLVESYFSPSDLVTAAIEKALLSAGGDLEFALLSFTQDDLGAAVLNRHNSGEAVKGIIESTGDLGTEFTPLQAAGVAVVADNHSVDIHHKYAIIDANSPGSDPQVVTGSHNWSNSAADDNDENTLIIHDEEIANWYLQEFSKRYCEITGTSGCQVDPPVSVARIASAQVETRLYPNPTLGNSSLEIHSMEVLGDINIQVFNALGQQLYQTQVNTTTYSHNLSLPSSEWPTGTYFVQIINNKQLQAVHRLVVGR